MKLIIATHENGNKAFAFKVSDELAPYMRKGRKILVETRRGLSIALCETQAFSGPGPLTLPECWAPMIL